MGKMRLFFILFFLLLSIFYIGNSIFLRPKIEIETITQKNSNEIDTLTHQDKVLIDSSKSFYDYLSLDNQFNGAIVVAKKGRILFEAFNGKENLKENNPINSATSFHLASVSKTFTAIALLKLFHSKTLSIDTPISTYFKGYLFDKITVRQLLNHRSGLPNYVYFAKPLKNNKKYHLTNEDILDYFKEKNNKFQITKSGTKFEYSNTNYVLIALIIEKVSGMSFHQFLKKTIFDPLIMKTSYVFLSENENDALPSFKSNNEKEPFTFLDNIYGDKNIYSSISDLVKWDNALYDTNFLPPSIRDNAFLGYSNEKKGIRNYGLGWRLFELKSGKKIIYHNGWWHGNNTVFCRLPQDSTVIIVLGNKYNTKIYEADKITLAFNGYQKDDTTDK